MELERLLEGSLQERAFRLLSALEEAGEGLRGAVLDEMEMARELIAKAVKLTDAPLTRLVAGSHAPAAHAVLMQGIEGLGDEIRARLNAGAEDEAQALLLRRDSFAFLAHLAGLEAGEEPDNVTDEYRETAARWVAASDARAGRTQA